MLQTDRFSSGKDDWQLPEHWGHNFSNDGAMIFFSSFFRVLIPKSPVLFPLRLNLWRFHIYPKFCPRALVESVLLRKVGGTPKWITIRVVWKVWVRFPRILLARLFHRQVIIHTTVTWVLFKPSKKCHCSKTCNFLSCFLYYFFSLFLSNFSLTLVLILAFLVKVEFWMVFVLLCPVVVVFLTVYE